MSDSYGPHPDFLNIHVPRLFEVFLDWKHACSQYRSLDRVPGGTSGKVHRLEDENRKNFGSCSSPAGAVRSGKSLDVIFLQTGHGVRVERLQV